MWILGVSRHHNGSVCLLKDGEIIFHLEEERLSRRKRDFTPYFTLLKTLEYTDHIDHLVLSGIGPLPQVEWYHDTNDENVYSMILKKHFNLKSKKPFAVHNWSHNHHEMHAVQGFYNSGFEKAVVVVADGAGSVVDNKIEIESIFTAEYPAKFTKVYENYHSENNISCGWKFEMMAAHLGFGQMDAGKVMGLSSYGKPNPNIPNLSNNKFFSKTGFVPPIGLERNLQNDADLSYELQRSTQEQVLNLINKAVELTGCKNVIVVGGYGLNCVANYFYLNHLHKDVNLYVEPNSSDGGVSIGAAKKVWHHITGDTTIRKIDNIYYGPKPTYDIQLNDGENSTESNYSDIIELILKGELVALFQGSSESGPRALGNRTLLFDPRHHDGKKIVNKIKKREWFRPFAGTILQEYAHDYFDMRGLAESPFMMYAVNVKSGVENIVPAITHVDNTCRIQTVTEEQNTHYYNLIKEFYIKTGVPILFNTSFNLAGEPLVETIDDALHTLRNSDIKYLYLPEINKLITIENKNV
jgi:carbamoyltransferase